MAFFLTPRFAPAYQQCGPFACAPQRPSPRFHRVSRPSFPSFVPFLSQLDELFSELDRDARRAAHQQRQQRQQRKRAFRARFDVRENKEGYEVEGEVPGFDRDVLLLKTWDFAFRARFDVRENKEGYEVEGEVPGFEQEDIAIEVTDEHTLKVAGNTEHKAEQAPAVAEPEKTVEAAKDVDMDGVTLNEPEAPARAASPASDAGSHKSYQATVEDDFEDLGAETSSTVSADSAPKGSKGKEKVVDEPTVAETAVQQQPQPAEPENREWLSERTHGSFERTFRFPERIDAANVRAALRNGVLSINVPKAPAPTVRQIVIR